MEDNSETFGALDRNKKWLNINTYKNVIDA